MKNPIKLPALFVMFIVLPWMSQVSAQQKYDLLLKGGYVIDPKNKISAVRDVAIANGKVAAVAAKINPADALKVVDASGYYVTPGLIDIHVHVYAGTGERSSYAGDNSLYPDGFTFRVGVTTVADAGCAGWRNFEDFKHRIIDRSKTRILAFLNIVGNGMRGGKFEQDLADMEAKPTAEMALRYPGLIVGVKTAHYAGPEWAPVERAVEAGTTANIPVMVDFGTNHPDKRPLSDLVTKKLRPGDIYTHLYSGLRNEQLENGQVNPALWEGRKRGVIFDVGHGGGSFLWRVAVPAMKAGFVPDSISTDLHIGSMNAGMKDMLNVMDKFLAMGMSLDDVILRSTWNPAREIKHEELGQLSPGAVADLAVLKLEKGNFGFTDMYGARLRGTQKLTCELTLRDGRVVYDLNGITRPDWDKLPRTYNRTGDARWDAVTPAQPARRGSNDMSVRLALLFLSLTLTLIGAARQASAPKGKPIPPKTVALTFDDAVKTHLTVVAPLLKQLGFRATFFITQKWMEDQAYFLTWDEVARIHRMGFEIGNHSWTHSDFGKAENGGKLGAELELVEKELAKVGVPKPVSFAWCGNAFGPEALEQLRRRGYVVARRGMQPDVPYGAIQVGPALQVKKHHPLLIPTTGDAYPAWTFEHFKKVLLSAKADEIIVLQFHGVPDEKHPWVNTPPAAFREYMTYLKQNGYRTLALRDLLQYYDSALLPDDPLLKARCCAK